MSSVEKLARKFILLCYLSQELDKITFGLEIRFFGLKICCKRNIEIGGWSIAKRLIVERDINSWRQCSAD
jgi:hypothetical protein